MSCQDQWMQPNALSAAGTCVVEYMLARTEPSASKFDGDDPFQVDERIEAAERAKRQLRILGAAGLKTLKKKRRSGEHGKAYDTVREIAAKRGGSIDAAGLVAEFASGDEVSRIVADSGIGEDAVKRIHAVLSNSGRRIATDGKQLVGLVDNETFRVLNDGDVHHDGLSGLLLQIDTYWHARGRGLATLYPPSPNGKDRTAAVASWSESLASGLVACEWFIDRDVRTLQDLGALPEETGNDGGATAIVGLVVVLVGVILIAISGCVSDPTLRDVLFAIGIVLTVIGGVLLVAGGAPVSVCRTDPATGARVCARI